ncbi:hypothetical protein PRIPAC_79191 [Pristionchus pacificus]|uniref:G protein-coupled receptor n=1 Tax=Pristionchus pacificus TaxID=54126 RepID=A0A2A6CK77_PRIPA|nr:hypothetical protein PRIPAC_79191 [Pristionchus pacificus]|eukprot:PDM78510.1 G protein-coupled receptor [Pristionchus pacificus]
MRERGYVNPILNDITYFFQILITCLAFVFNVILIVIVRKSTNKGIGKYRNLITYFALSDIYYNSVHFIVYPIPENYGNAFFMRCHGIYTEFIGGAFYAGAYAHTFPILIFHFLYRLLSIKYPHYLKRFSYYLLALVAVTLTCNLLFFSTFYWLFRPEPEIIVCLTPIFNGSIPLPIVHTMDTTKNHQIAFYWTRGTFEGPRWRNLLGTGIICSTMFLAYAIILCCCFLINKYLKGATKSTQSIRLQKQLFRSLIYQVGDSEIQFDIRISVPDFRRLLRIIVTQLKSFVPLFTAYYPAGSALLLPVIGVTFTPISIFVPPVCVTHSLVDPLLLILTISEYRKSFFSLICLYKFARSANVPMVSRRISFQPAAQAAATEIVVDL